MRTSVLTFLAAVTAALALAPSAMADTATADLFLARDDCGGTDNPHLSYNLGAFTDACGSLAAAVAPSGDVYDSGTLPLTFGLDTSREGKIDITVSSRESLGYGIGDQQIDVTLTGVTTGKKTVTLFSGSDVKAAADMLGGANYTAEFTFPLTGIGGPYKSFSLDVSVGGASLAGYISNGADSLVSLPVADGTVLVPEEDEE